MSSEIQQETGQSNAVTTRVLERIRGAEVRVRRAEETLQKAIVQAELASLREGMAELGFTVGRNPDGVDDTVAATLLVVRDAMAELAKAQEAATLQQELREAAEEVLDFKNDYPTDLSVNPGWKRAFARLSAALGRLP
jgi:soluble cytochrome b562